MTVRFTLTAALLGVAALWLSIITAAVAVPGPQVFDLIHAHGQQLCRTVIALSCAKLVWEATIFRHLFSGRMTSLRRSALLLARDCSSVTLARFALGALGGVIMPALMASEAALLTPANALQFTVMTGVLFAACLGGELLERYLFFTACAAPRMPGGIR